MTVEQIDLLISEMNMNFQANDRTHNRRCNDIGQAIKACLRAAGVKLAWNTKGIFHRVT